MCRMMSLNHTYQIDSTHLRSLLQSCFAFKVEQKFRSKYTNLYRTGKRRACPFLSSPPLSLTLVDYQSDSASGLLVGTCWISLVVSVFIRWRGSAGFCCCCAGTTNHLCSWGAQVTKQICYIHTYTSKHKTLTDLNKTFIRVCVCMCSTLSQVLHAVAALLFPFIWQHTFISIVPKVLIDVYLAPTPYLLGIQRNLLPFLTEHSDVSICVCVGGGLLNSVSHPMHKNTQSHTKYLTLILFGCCSLAACCWPDRPIREQVHHQSELHAHTLTHTPVPVSGCHYLQTGP